MMAINLSDQIAIHRLERQQTARRKKKLVERDVMVRVVGDLQADGG